jgi:hypothetical protein
MRPKICIGCERSGRIRDAFLDRGFDAISCDIEPSDSDRGKSRHYQGDILDLIGEEWDLFIVHPTCRYLCNSGVRWLHTIPGRWQLMVQAAEFFRKCLGANAKRVCAENPIPHRYAMEIIKEKYSQIVQPWQYGHGETKATCLWLRNLPLLKPTNIVSGRYGMCHRLPPGPNRERLRSVTYQGIADAIAEQWGAILNMESGFTSGNTAMQFTNVHAETGASA